MNIIKKLAFMLAFAGIAMASFSQGITTASMNGRVTDDTGDGLPGATIVAVHNPTGTSYGTTSRIDGGFNLPNVQIGGPYTVTISFVGYSPEVITDIRLSLGEDRNFAITLYEDHISLDEVVVFGTVDKTFNSGRTGAATNIDTRQMEMQPTISRNFTDLTRLVPQSSGTSFMGRHPGFSNVTIDGSIFNNNFGLSAAPTPGGGFAPVSLDAIEEIQVNIAPYDVRQGGFTGAGVNAITRSGTNEFVGSAYSYMRNQNFQGNDVAGAELTFDESSTMQYGFRLGGPIVQNKLFFFVNLELEGEDFPGQQYLAARPGISGPNVTRVQASELDELSSFLSSRYGYETGGYEGYGHERSNTRMLARLDWNVNETNRLTLRFNQTLGGTDILVNNTSGPTSVSPRTSPNSMGFRNTNYIANNDVWSMVGEWNWRISNQFSNNTSISFTRINDYRSSNSQIFPFVDIMEGGPTNSYTSFGYELFSPNNRMDNDVLNFTNNFTYYTGRHTLTAGMNAEYMTFANGFTRFYHGYYRFASLQDFYDSANGLGTQPLQYAQTYSTLPGGTPPLAESSFAQIGLYLQDAWNVTDQFKLTAGFRVDMPFYPKELLTNPALLNLTFRDLDNDPEVLDVGKLPDVLPLWSPRFGFNWDVYGDRSLQLRGGSGIFTGRIPFVWISNQVTNSGMLQDVITVTGPESGYDFNPDWTAYIPSPIPTPGQVAPSSVATTAGKFKYPQVWRTNLAVDTRLPWGINATLEGLYSKDINAVFHRNANQLDPNTNASGADQRPIWFPRNNDTRRVNPGVTDAIVLDNSSEGYSYFITGTLEKGFNSGLYTSLSYTYNEVKDLTSHPGSQAASAWRAVPVISNLNRPGLSWSDFAVPHRIIGTLSYRKEYLNNFATSVAIFYEGTNQGRFSYIYNGDMNGDGQSNHELIYVPENSGEIVFQEFDGHTPANQWAALDAYIKQDTYLETRRGDYAERNGVVRPMVNRFDFRVMQDFFVNVQGKRNVIQLSLDIMNVGNIINSEWGIYKSINNNRLLNFREYNGDGEPVFRMATNPDGTLLNETYRDAVTLSSVWRAQFGVRYIFN
jgi:hypothetical protein